MSCSSKYQQLKEYIKSKRDAYQDLLDHIDKLDNPSVSLDSSYNYSAYNFGTDLVSADFSANNYYAADTVDFDFGGGQDHISFDVGAGNTASDDAMIDLS